MNNNNCIKSAIKSPTFNHIIICLYLCVYLTIGFYTELKLIEEKPIPNCLLEDFRFYERALNDALNGKDPYAIRSIGPGYLYPSPTLLIIEIFNHIKSFFLKVSLYSTLNIALLALIVYGITRYYGYSRDKVWYWYVICLGFAPFLELLHIGQINVITLFGIFMLFRWADTSPILSGIGLGLAVITKVSPILFLVYLVANRKFKVMAATIAVIALITCLSILRYGLSPVLEYPETFQWIVNQFPLGRNSQSLVAKLAIGNSIQFQNIISIAPQALQLPIVSIFAFFNSEYHIVHRILTLYILSAIVISGLFTAYGKQPREPLFIITTLGMMLSPNIMWYHHYVFILLPLLLWMGWRRLDRGVVTWCLIGLLIVQIDRQLLTCGLLIHIFGHLSLLSILLWQIQQFCSRRKVERIGLFA